LAIEPTVRVNDCRDAKDNKYLELALAAGAAVIVSSDNDLLALSPWRGVRIVTPAAFVAEFEAGSEPTSPGSNPAS
jgi:predicted nucleic acid-binding protein